MRLSLPVLFFFPLWWCGIAFLLAQGMLTAGFPLHPLLWAIAWLGAVGGTVLLGASWRAAIVTGLLWLGGWVALSGIALLVTDFSWDGQAYHQEAMLQLARGWNPTRILLTHADTPHTSWINPYPKASWYLGTLTFQIFGRIEAAKAPVWLLGLAAAGMTALWAERLPVSRPMRWALGSLWCLNPVIVCQWATFQVDGLVAVCLGGVLLCTLGVAFPERSPWPRSVSIAGLCVWLLILASLKFTGLVYGVYAVICLGSALLIRRPNPVPLPRRGEIFLALFLLVAVPLTLYHPYAQNYQRYGHPLWPVMGPRPEDVIGYQEHPVFLAQNRLVKFVWANNAVTRQVAGFRTREDAQQYGTPQWKPPFFLYPRELRWYVAPDVHIGGFGPWYGGALWAAILLLAVGVWRGWPGAPGTAWLWGIVLGSVLLNPEAWWARYAPQAWWLVLLPVLPALQAGRGEQRVGMILLTVIAVDMLIVAGINTAGQGISEIGMRRQMHLLAQHPQNWRIGWGLARSNRERYREWNIPATPYVPGSGQGWYAVKLIRTDTTVYTRDMHLAHALKAAPPIRQ